MGLLVLSLSTNFMGLLVLSLSHMCGGVEMMVGNLESIVVGELVAPLGAHDGSSSIVLDGEIEDSTLSTALAMVPMGPRRANHNSVGWGEVGLRSDGSPEAVSRGGRVFSGTYGIQDADANVMVNTVFLITVQHLRPLA